METVRRFGEISKIEERPEGLYLQGVASTEAEDRDGEVILASAMRRALASGYFMREPSGEMSGPVREMHQLSAVGKTIAAEVDSAGRTIVEMIIIDKAAAEKVRRGVYRSLSVGGRVPPGGRSKDDPRIVENLILSEISLVDRGANPEAEILMWKLDDPRPEDDQGEQISKLAARLDGALSKVAALTAERDEALAKAAALGRRVQKFMGERDAARSRLAKAARTHAAEVGRLTAERDRYFVQANARGSLRAVEITKAEDNGSAPARPPDPEDVHTLIRRAHARPGQLFDPPRR